MRERLQELEEVPAALIGKIKSSKARKRTKRIAKNCTWLYHCFSFYNYAIFRASKTEAKSHSGSSGTKSRTVMPRLFSSS